MKDILLFGGASETHDLLARLANLPLKITLSVASEYGRSLLPPQNTKLQIITGVLAEDAMCRLMQKGNFCAVIDATHPYAVNASANISAAAIQNNLPYLRLLRQASDTSGCITVANATQAVAEIHKYAGNVLLTTGSKDLQQYAAIKDYTKRLYVRVLPEAKSLAACRELGLSPQHIIAMQGPFSSRLNQALIKEYNIQVLVTKDGGARGGFPQKLQAAQKTGCTVIVLGRPEEKGLYAEDLFKQIAILIGG